MSQQMMCDVCGKSMGVSAVSEEDAPKLRFCGLACAGRYAWAHKQIMKKLAEAEKQ